MTVKRRESERNSGEENKEERLKSGDLECGGNVEQGQGIFEGTEGVRNQCDIVGREMGKGKKIKKKSEEIYGKSRRHKRKR